MNEFDTSTGYTISSDMVEHYFTHLIDRFYKILPIRERGDETLPVYISGLQKEMIGCRELIHVIHDDALYLSLLSQLQFMADNPLSEVSEIRRYVFKSISICVKLRAKYCKGGDNDDRMGTVSEQD